jgi:hypothetical protein
MKPIKKLNRMKLFLLVSIILSFISQAVTAECIPVAGMEFERISDRELLGIKNRKNFAVLTISTCAEEYLICGELPSKMNSFRFFSEELCTVGAERRFHIDGQLFFLSRVQVFKK